MVTHEPSLATKAHRVMRLQDGGARGRELSTIYAAAFAHVALPECSRKITWRRQAGASSTDNWHDQLSSKQRPSRFPSSKCGIV